MGSRIPHVNHGCTVSYFGFWSHQLSGNVSRAAAPRGLTTAACRMPGAGAETDPLSRFFTAILACILSIHCWLAEACKILLLLLHVKPAFVWMLQGDDDMAARMPYLDGLPMEYWVVPPRTPAVMSPSLTASLTSLCRSGHAPSTASRTATIPSRPPPNRHTLVASR